MGVDAVRFVALLVVAALVTCAAFVGTRAVDSSIPAVIQFGLVVANVLAWVTVGLVLAAAICA